MCVLNRSSPVRGTEEDGRVEEATVRAQFHPSPIFPYYTSSFAVVRSSVLSRRRQEENALFI